MKTRLLATLLAALGTAALAYEGHPGPHRDFGPEPGLCRDDSTSAACKAEREGMELRRAEHKARSAYFKALKENKDASSEKAALLAAMDNLNGFEKAHVEDMAKAMLAQMAKDTCPCKCHRPEPRHGRHEGMGPSPDGAPQGGPDMLPPPEGRDGIE